MLVTTGNHELPIDQSHFCISNSYDLNMYMSTATDITQASRDTTPLEFPASTINNESKEDHAAIIQLSDSQGGSPMIKLLT